MHHSVLPFPSVQEFFGVQGVRRFGQKTFFASSPRIKRPYALTPRSVASKGPRFRKQVGIPSSSKSSLPCTGSCRTWFKHGLPQCQVSAASVPWFVSSLLRRKITPGQQQRAKQVNPRGKPCMKRKNMSLRKN